MSPSTGHGHQEESDSDSLLSAAANRERLRWRAAPCPRCRGSSTAVGYLVGRIGAGEAFSASRPEEIARVQIELLTQWVQTCPHTSEISATLPRLDAGSEHIVYISPEVGLVFKVTRPGLYGDSYYLVDGKINQRNCSPLEYLLRLRFWRKLFGSSPKVLGVTPEGQFVSVQKFYRGDLPQQADLHAFLHEKLEPVRSDLWLWKRKAENMDLWVGDARADNFVDTATGIVPIDLRIWLSDSDKGGLGCDNIWKYGAR